MAKSALSVPVVDSGKVKIVGVGTGQERFAFLYVVVAAVIVAAVMTFTSVAGLGWPHRALMLIGCTIVGCAVLFSALEFRRLSQSEQQRSEDRVDAARTAYPSGTAAVEPPTGEACPHHEDHMESPGFDQGQLTSQLPEDTPLIPELLGGRTKR